MKRIHGLLGAVLLAAASGAAAQSADSYPSRPVRLVVGYAAGGPTDVSTRVMAQYLSTRLGQQFVVENRTGAGGNIAVEAVAKSAPDGYTLLMIVTAYVINTALYPNLPFNFLRDIAPVAGLVRISYVVAVHPSLPIHNVNDLIAYAKANPGKLNFASGGIGSSSHLSTEILKGMTGTQFTHVPYKGNTAAYADIVSGRIQFMLADRMSAMPHLQSGALRTIAVTSTTRNEAMPSVPTVAETVPGYEASAFYGVGAPRGTPTAILDKLNAAVNAGLADPAVKARYAELDAAPLVFSPASAFGDFMAREAQRWGKAVRDSGARPE